MNIVTIKAFLALFLLVFSYNSFSKEINVVYINGIQNSDLDAFNSHMKIRDILSESENHQNDKINFNVEYIWNPNGFFGNEANLLTSISDIVELYALKAVEEVYYYDMEQLIAHYSLILDSIDHVSNTRPEINIMPFTENLASDKVNISGVGSLSESIFKSALKGTEKAIDDLYGKVKILENPTIIIAHSEGNLLANLAYVKLINDIGYEKAVNKVRIVNIANVAAFSLHGLNLTHSDDAAIANMYDLGLIAPKLSRNTQFCITGKCVFEKIDPATFTGYNNGEIHQFPRHSFTEIYLSDINIPNSLMTGTLLIQPIEFTPGKTRFRDRFEDLVYVAANSLLSGLLLAIDTTTIPNPKSCTPYEHQLKAIGGKPPYTWSKGKNPNDAGSPVEPGSEPIDDRLNLSITSTGKIYGTPAKDTWNSSIDFEITAILEDATGKMTSKKFDIDVEKAGTTCNVTSSGSNDNTDGFN